MHLEFISNTHTYRDSADAVHEFTGCTLLGLIEFNLRYKELHELWDQLQTFTVQDAYLMDARFRFLCDKCLRLNGIEPCNVSALSLSQLLFVHTDLNGEICDYGALIPINRIKENGRKSNGEPLTTSTAIAMASYLTDGNSLDAIDLLNRLSANDAIELVETVFDSNKTGEDRERDRYQTWKENMARHGVS